MEENQVWWKDAGNSNFGHGEKYVRATMWYVKEEIGFMSLGFSRNFCTGNVDLEVISIDRVIEDS